MNWDTLITTGIIGVIAFGFLWLVTRKATAGVPSKRQAFVELTVDFVNDQVKGIYHGESKVVAPIALTTFVLVLFLNAMDFLPVDIMSKFYEHVFGQHTWRGVPDGRRQHDVRAGAVGVRADDLLQHQGQGPRRLDPRALLLAVRQQSAALGCSICCSTPSSTCRSRCPTRCGSTATCTPGEIIFMLLGLWAATGVVGAVLSGVLHLGWSIFHILIVALQAYIFMMLTIVYISMAHEHH